MDDRGLRYQVVFRGFLLLMAGVPVYVFMKWRRARDEATPAAGRADGDGHGDNVVQLTA